MTKPPEVAIAEAGTADIDAIAEFFWAAWRSSGPEAPGWAGASEEVMAEITAPELLRTRIGGPQRRMFLAWVDDRVVGFASTRTIDEHTVELAGIVVLEEVAGRGIGTPLAEAAASAAGATGAQDFIVRTETTNERAIGFYRARGFTERSVTTEEVEGVTVEVVELIRPLQ